MSPRATLVRAAPRGRALARANDGATVSFQNTVAIANDAALCVLDSEPVTAAGSGLFVVFGFVSGAPSAISTPQLALLLDPPPSGGMPVVAGRQYFQSSSPSYPGSIALFARIALDPSLGPRTLRLRLDASGTTTVTIPATLLGGLSAPELGMALTGFELPEDANSFLVNTDGAMPQTATPVAPLSIDTSVTPSGSGLFIVFGFVSGTNPANLSPQLALLVDPPASGGVPVAGRQFSTMSAIFPLSARIALSPGSHILRLQLDVDTGALTVPPPTLGGLSAPQYGMILFGWELP